MPMKMLKILFVLNMTLVAGCGLSNSLLGVSHALYQEDAARCLYCAENGEMCTRLVGADECVGMETMSDCAAAETAEPRDADGPVIFPVTDASISMSPIDACDAGFDEIIVNIGVYDRYGDVSLSASWDGDPSPFDLSQDVFLQSENEVAEIREWNTQATSSDDGRTIFDVRVSACVQDDEAEGFSLVVLDERGNRSNTLCLSAPGGSDEE